MYTTLRPNTELNQDTKRSKQGLCLDSILKPNQDKPAIYPDLKPVLTLGQNKGLTRTMPKLKGDLTLNIEMKTATPPNLN